MPRTLKSRKAVIERFMQAYRESIDYMYSDNPQVMTDYADFAGVAPALAKRVRDEFFPKSLMQMTEIKGSTRCCRSGRPEIHPDAADQGADRRADPDPAAK